MDFPVCILDMNGNKMNLRDVPEDCGYSASMGKDGKIHLSLPLHLRCYMSSQASLASHWAVAFCIIVSVTACKTLFSPRVQCTSSPLCTQHLMGQERLRFPVQVWFQALVKVDCCFTSLQCHSVGQRLLSPDQSYLNCVPDLCHAVPQSATFLANNASPVDPALYPSLCVSQWVAASANAVLPVTTPWMASCILCSQWYFHTI